MPHFGESARRADFCRQMQSISDSSRKAQIRKTLNVNHLSFLTYFESANSDNFFTVLFVRFMQKPCFEKERVIMNMVVMYHRSYMMSRISFRNFIGGSGKVYGLWWVVHTVYGVWWVVYS